MRNLIEGYNELEKKLRYKPNFHDDKIESVTITKDRVEFDLKTVDKVFYKLLFEDVKEINLKGELWDIVGIISELEIERIDGILKTEINSSLGVDGEIKSGRIIVK